MMEVYGDSMETSIESPQRLMEVDGWRFMDLHGGVHGDSTDLHVPSWSPSITLHGDCMDVLGTSMDGKNLAPKETRPWSLHEG